MTRPAAPGADPTEVAAAGTGGTPRACGDADTAIRPGTDATDGADRR
ncbi:hypothetical protein MXD62_20220 [Frankia sp. Mgl5]|nr:hypothetical protein [Frankia sp. Mgl5]MCK9929477.1 hypothetical protein [Frankia sp. Mgl5]